MTGFAGLAVSFVKFVHIAALVIWQLIFGEEMEALSLGSVQMLAPSLAKFGPLGVRDFEVFDLPYLFDDYADLHKVTEGPAGKALFRKLEGKGIVGLAYWDNGFKILSSNKALRTPADVKGQKMRIQSSQVLSAQMKALGLKTDDINYVINSHYHFDHCGGNKHLGKACTICHAKELEASGNCQPFEHLGYSDLTFAPDLHKAKNAGKQLPPDPALDIFTPKFETMTGDQEIATGSLAHISDDAAHGASRVEEDEKG